MHIRRLAPYVASIALLFTSVTIPTVHAQAERTRPVATVSIASLDKMLKDSRHLLEVCGVAEMGMFVLPMVEHYTQGLDKSKPIGVFVTLDGQMPSALICLPVASRQEFFKGLEGMGIEPDDLGDGVYEVTTPGQTLFAKDANGWLYVAQSEQELLRVPADPAAGLGNLPSRYNVATRIDVQALPPELKAMATEQMRIGFENAMAAQDDQSEEQQAATKAAGEAQLAQIEQLMEETEQIFIGWTVDAANQLTYIDTGAQFLAGSKLAAQVEAYSDLTSDFTAFQLPYAAIKFRATSVVLPEDKELTIQNLRNSWSQVNGMIDKQDLPPEAAALAKELLSGLSKIVEKTVEEGKFDGALSVSTTDDSLKLLVGGRLADGTAMVKELKKVAEAVSNAPNAPTFEFEYGAYKGVTLHRISAPLRIADPAAKRVFGENLVLTLGTANDGFMLALDGDGDASLKAAIDAMENSKTKPVTPMDGIIEVGQILAFAKAISPNPFLESAVQTIQQYAGKDTVKMNGKMIERGAVYRLSIDEGIMRAAGAAAKGANNRSGF